MLLKKKMCAQDYLAHLVQRDVPFTIIKCPVSEACLWNALKILSFTLFVVNICSRMWNPRKFVTVLEVESISHKAIYLDGCLFVYLYSCAVNNEPKRLFEQGF